MNYKKGASRVMALMLASSLCFFIAHRSTFFIPGMVEYVASYCLYPFLKLQLHVVDPVAHYMHRISFITSLEKEYEALLQERDILQAQVIELQGMQTFVKETEEIREFAKNYRRETAFLVRILIKYFGTDGHFFIVDGGSNKGIHKDTAVVYKNCLVGKVTEVYPYMSKVVLITDSRCKVASYCNETGTQGIYEGALSLKQGTLTHIGHLCEVKEGDTVFSSGEGLVFPKGFGIGTIIACRKNEGDMYYTVSVTPLVDLKSIDYCYVLNNDFEVFFELETTQKNL